MISIERSAAIALAVAASIALGGCIGTRRGGPGGGGEEQPATPSQVFAIVGFPLSVHVAALWTRDGAFDSTPRVPWRSTAFLWPAVHRGRNRGAEHPRREKSCKHAGCSIAARAIILGLVLVPVLGSQLALAGDPEPPTTSPQRADRPG